MGYPHMKCVSICHCNRSIHGAWATLKIEVQDIGNGVDQGSDGDDHQSRGEAARPQPKNGGDQESRGTAQEQVEEEVHRHRDRHVDTQHRQENDDRKDSRVQAQPDHDTSFKIV